MYNKNKLGIPFVDFNYINLTEFHKIYGSGNHNIISHNFNNYTYSRTRIINRKLYGIYMNYIIH